MSSFLVAAEPDYELEFQAGPAWQSRNEFNVPNPGGTRFRLTSQDRGPVTAMRAYATWNWKPNHSLRLLYAPFSVETVQTPAAAVSFNGTSFASGKTLRTLYVFNSYRLSYIYRIPSESKWRFRVGFTAKIRDALLRVNNGDALSEFSNVGFVPLLNLGARYTWNERWFLDFDLDGAAAPQGRAFDFAVKVSRGSDTQRFSLGYRTLEGGADNDRVFSFAWLHYLFIGATFGF